MSRFPFFFFILFPASPYLSLSQPCTSHPFFENRLFDQCATLPRLSASLLFTFNSSNSTLTLAFAAPSPGWAAWGIGRGMVGAQSVISFRRPDGTVGINTFNITQYGPVAPSKIAFETWGLEAKAEGGLVLGFFATVKLPEGVRSVGQVWQVGPVCPAVTSGGMHFHRRTWGLLELLT